MSTPILILSPQAGFGNRIRMLCSGIVLAEILGRTPVYYWPRGNDINSADTYFVGQAREQGWGGFFCDHPDFPSATLNGVPTIDRSFSEWLPGEFWYPMQSTAHELWGKHPDDRMFEDADGIEQYSDDQVILIESSRELKLSRYSQREWHQLMSKAYAKYFQPQKEYLDRLSCISHYDVGIAIRRGKFLTYFPEEAHEEEALLRWLDGIENVHKRGSIVLFSDDHALRDQFRTHLQERGISCPNLQWEGLQPWQIAFLEFLILATHVSQCIYGTPASSFAEQAAIFNGISFLPIQPRKGVSELLQCKEEVDGVTIAILAKDKAHVLPLYLGTIENQTYPAAKTRLYIRTNNNNDNTAEVLRAWVEEVKDRYAEVHFDESNIDQPVEQYSPHDWNPMRLNVMGNIRKASTEWARERKTHYFVADCDNFISPDTIESLLKTNLPVIGPFLRNGDDDTNLYSNYHFVVDGDGYYRDHSFYLEILGRSIQGLIEVEVIHCTYLIRYDVLDKVQYVDSSTRHEYVIFSDTLRRLGIPQYIDNRREYGKLTFCDTAEEFEKTNIGFITLIPEMQSIISAWKGHEQFVMWLVGRLRPDTIVDLGVDYGYSTFCFGVQSIGMVYGIDHFRGDAGTEYRDTYPEVMRMKGILYEKYNIDIEIIRADFTDAAARWKKPIDILHIDGDPHSVEEDYARWFPHLKEDGILLLHDVSFFPEVRKVYDESDLYRCHFTHAYGLGILSRNKEIIEEIVARYDLVLECPNKESDTVAQLSQDVEEGLTTVSALISAQNHYLDKNREVFDFVYSHFLETDNITKKMLYAKSAGHVAWMCHPGFFVHELLEEELHKMGQYISAPDIPVPDKIKRKRPHFLHVLTTAYTVGGHTRLADRMINLRSDYDERHSVVLTDQGVDPIPEWLENTVRQSGGDFVVNCDSEKTIAEKAMALRELAYQSADVVFLHIHPRDPVPSVAFGVPGGPPVVLVNHADHVFWLGAGIADVVVNISSSGEGISVKRRNVRKTARLPIPLEAKVPSDRIIKRENFGISEDATVLLSIAEGYKYLVLGDLDFPTVMSAVLDLCPKAVLIVVGVDDINQHWNNMVEKHKGRFIVLNRCTNISDYYHLSDIFVESFSIPSFTSTLDAALYGIPAFRAPLSPLSPLFMLDHYDGMNQPPEDIPSYINELVNLINNDELRKEKGLKQYRAVTDLHTGDAWNGIFDKLISAIPDQHEVGFKSSEYGSEVMSAEAVWASVKIYGQYDIYHQAMLDTTQWIEDTIQEQSRNFLRAERDI